MAPPAISNTESFPGAARVLSIQWTCTEATDLAGPSFLHSGIVLLDPWQLPVDCPAPHRAARRPFAAQLPLPGPPCPWWPWSCLLSDAPPPDSSLSCSSTNSVARRWSFHWSAHSKLWVNDNSNGWLPSGHCRTNHRVPLNQRRRRAPSVFLPTAVSPMNLHVLDW